MAVITIIGLGKIGASAGLALAEKKETLTRQGHDREPEIARKAQKMGAVDKVFFNLPASVEGADIVLLALPLNEIRETLKVIAPSLRENAVVLETSPVKSVVAAWMKELLPPKCHYVGLVPAINSIYLQSDSTGVDAAQVDLFVHGMMAITCPQGTAGEAVKVGADLAGLLGAKPFFADMAEVDGMMAALHLLPQVSALSLAHMMMTRPGWKDARKLSGVPYTMATMPVNAGDEEAGLVDALLLNQADNLRVLDELTSALQETREKIAQQDREGLKKWLDFTRQGHSLWRKERDSGEYQATDFKVMDIPRQSVFKRLFGDLGKWFGPPKPKDDGQRR